MYAERDTLGPASLSILATRSSDRVNDVLAFIPPLYYQAKTLINSAGEFTIANGTMEGWTSSLTASSRSAPETASKVKKSREPRNEHGNTQILH